MGGGGGGEKFRYLAHGLCCLSMPAVLGSFAAGTVVCRCHWLHGPGSLHTHRRAINSLCSSHISLCCEFCVFHTHRCAVNTLCSSYISLCCEFCVFHTHRCAVNCVLHIYRCAVNSVFSTHIGVL